MQVSQNSNSSFRLTSIFTTKDKENKQIFLNYHNLKSKNSFHTTFSLNDQQNSGPLTFGFLISLISTGFGLPSSFIAQ